MRNSSSLVKMASRIERLRELTVSRDKIKEVLLQTAVYCGVPDANAAFRVAQRVFEEADVQHDSQ
jgi:alkylhydroperoxidase/carboxymuconolactone decarboxylase family protein YurZ